MTMPNDFIKDAPGKNLSGSLLSPNEQTKF